MIRSSCTSFWGFLHTCRTGLETGRPISSKVHPLHCCLILISPTAVPKCSIHGIKKGCGMHSFRFISSVQFSYILPISLLASAPLLLHSSRNKHYNTCLVLSEINITVFTKFIFVDVVLITMQVFQHWPTSGITHWNQHIVMVHLHADMWIKLSSTLSSVIYRRSFNTTGGLRQIYKNFDVWSLFVFSIGYVYIIACNAVWQLNSSVLQSDLHLHVQVHLNKLSRWVF